MKRFSCFINVAQDNISFFFFPEFCLQVPVEALIVVRHQPELTEITSPAVFGSLTGKHNYQTNEPFSTACYKSLVVE